MGIEIAKKQRNKTQTTHTDLYLDSGNLMAIEKQFRISLLYGKTTVFSYMQLYMIVVESK